MRTVSWSARFDLWYLDRIRLHRNFKTAILLAGTLSIGAQAASAAVDRVGTTAIAKNSVTGTLLKKTRQLTVGTQVFQNEHIRTGANGSAQLLFLDQTALNIGANAHIVLSRLVFDPKKKRGRVVLNAVSGAFRFISGSSPSKSYRIRTRFGTIGVRGTIVLIRLARTWMFLAIQEGGADLCRARCFTLRAGNYLVATREALGAIGKTTANSCSGGAGSFASVSGRSYCTVLLSPNNPLYIRALDKSLPILTLATLPVLDEPPRKKHRHRHRWRHWHKKNFSRHWRYHHHVRHRLKRRRPHRLHRQFRRIGLRHRLRIYRKHRPPRHRFSRIRAPKHVLRHQKLHRRIHKPRHRH